MAETIKIKHRNKVDKVPGDQLIKAYFEAEVNFNPALYNFVWECMGNTATTSTPKVLLSLPSFLCNTPITISVKAQSKKALWLGLQFSNNVQLDTDEEKTLPPLLGNIIYDELTFTPTCDVKFVSLDWCNKSVIPTYNDAPLPGKTFIVVSTRIQGLNGKDVVARLYNEHHEISRAGKVTENLLDFLFFASEQFLNGSDKSSVKLELSLQYRIIHLVSKEIEQPKTIVEPLKSYPIQTVMVGTVNIVENNYHPCKYTKITAKYPVGDSTFECNVFDESRFTQAKPICLVGGKKEIEITLNKYDTKKCRYKKGEEGAHRNNKALINGQDLVEIPNSGVFKIESTYTYNKENKSASHIIPDVVILKYLWPDLDVFCQKQYITIPTCRHECVVTINKYPDVEWTLELNLSTQSVAYSPSGMPAGDSFAKHQKKAIEYGQMRKYNISDLAIEFKLDAKYNDGSDKFSVTAKFQERIDSIVGVLGKIKEMLDLISGKNALVGKPGNFAPSLSKGLGGAPVFIEISNPEVSISGSWKPAISSTTYEPIREGSVKFGFTPLVKVKGGIDLIAAMKYIPLAGQVIKAIEIANEGVEIAVKWLSGGTAAYESDLLLNLYVFGEIKCTGKIEIAENNTTSRLDSASTVGVGLELAIKASIKVNTIEVRGNSKSSTTAGFKAEGKAETSVTFGGSYGVDFQGAFIELSVMFDGLTIIIKGEAGITKKEGKKNKSMSFSIPPDPIQAIKKSELAKEKFYLTNN